MAQDINSAVSFGQNKNDGDELPIIVAQRFLNIFRQLHIFSDERRKEFNKMLLELPPEVKNIFQTLPGGTPLQEYMENLQQENGKLTTKHVHDKKNNPLLQEAYAAQKYNTSEYHSPMNGDFAQILAHSLAQSNAEIIKELQNVKNSNHFSADVSPTSDASVKLIADESFTNILSKALAKAFEDSEKKRLEDNKVITQSFLELQKNLTKLIEQNGQNTFIQTDGKNTSVPVKSIIDNLVKAQSDFLKETSQNQKNELAAIISTAIKESQKMSTQALIDSFKQINSNSVPTPITYAAASPNGENQPLTSVEQVLKVQGKEFSSIISAALKESQKNSAQTIAETLENFKKSASDSGQSNLKIEEIMRMQANLFRDIARAQNQEFSALISTALKESQKQSTETIVAALNKFAQKADGFTTYSQSTEDTANLTYNYQQPLNTKKHISVEMIPEEIHTPLIDKYTEKENTNISKENTETDLADTQSPKKKKKKKKKNKNEGNSSVSDAQQNTQNLPTNEKKQEIENHASLSVSENKKLPSQENTEVKNLSEEITPKVNSSSSQSSMWEKLMTISNAFAHTSEIKDNDVNDWKWQTSDEENKQTSSSSITSETFDDDSKLSAEPLNQEQDWEWEYEEIPDNEDISGIEGQDWEWEYEYDDNSDNNDTVYGIEGQDWEWEYEDIAESSLEPDENVSMQKNSSSYIDDIFLNTTENSDNSVDNNSTIVIPTDLQTQSIEDIASNSEIVIEEFPKLVLLGIDEQNFQDPYIENNENLG